MGGVPDVLLRAPQRCLEAGDVQPRGPAQAADKLLLFPPLLSPDACRLPFRVERQGAIYLPASVDEPGPSGAPPASSARADAPRASPGQLAGNGPPDRGCGWEYPLLFVYLGAWVKLFC